MHKIKEWTAWADVISELRDLGNSRINAERNLRAAIASGELLKHCPCEEGDVYLVKTDEVKCKESQTKLDAGFNLDLDKLADEDWLKKIEALVEGTELPDLDDPISLF